MFRYLVQSIIYVHTFSQGLLGPKKELWDLLQKIEKLDAEASDITASVRDLPTVRSGVGRARAWLRLALMQVRMIDMRDEYLIRRGG